MYCFSIEENSCLHIHSRKHHTTRNKQETNEKPWDSAISKHRVWINDSKPSIRHASAMPHYIWFVQILFICLFVSHCDILFASQTVYIFIQNSYSWIKFIHYFDILQFFIQDFIVWLTCQNKQLNYNYFNGWSNNKKLNHFLHTHTHTVMQTRTYTLRLRLATCDHMKFRQPELIHCWKFGMFDICCFT